nr:translation initiation factor IF-2-like [Anser cygnoides]
MPPSETPFFLPPEVGAKNSTTRRRRALKIPTATPPPQRGGSPRSSRSQLVAPARLTCVPQLLVAVHGEDDQQVPQQVHHDGEDEDGGQGGGDPGRAARGVLGRRVPRQDGAVQDGAVRSHPAPGPGRAARGRLPPAGAGGSTQVAGMVVAGTRPPAAPGPPAPVHSFIGSSSFIGRHSHGARPARPRSIQPGGAAGRGFGVLPAARSACGRVRSLGSGRGAAAPVPAAPVPAAPVPAAPVPAAPAGRAQPLPKSSAEERGSQRPAVRRTRAKYLSQPAVGITLPFKAAAELASRRALPSAGCASGSGGRGASAGIETLLQTFIGRLGAPENSGRGLGSPQWRPGSRGGGGSPGSRGAAGLKEQLCGGPRGSAVIRGALRVCCHRYRLRDSWNLSNISLC